MRELLRTENLRKSFEGFAAISDVSIKVYEGEIVAVIGPNGAGKTTLFNLITGYIPMDSGRVFFEGKEITKLPAHEICKRGISRAFQIPNIFQRLTVFENVQISVLSREKKDLLMFSDASNLCVEETMEILEDVGLQDKKDIISSNLSHGDQKLLEIAMALGSKPKLLLLDEPTAGMSPEETWKTVSLIKDVASKRNVTILFTEHDMDVVFNISDRIVVMQQGRVIAEGRPEEVRAHPEVRKAYLGESA